MKQKKTVDVFLTLDVRTAKALLRVARIKQLERQAREIDVDVDDCMKDYLAPCYEAITECESFISDSDANWLEEKIRKAEEAAVNAGSGNPNTDSHGKD